MSETETKPDLTVERIRALMARKGWGQKETARYLGVPCSTFGNWVQGTKHPSAIVGRLLDVLATVEAFAPQVHVSLIPKGKSDE